MNRRLMFRFEYREGRERDYMTLYQNLPGDIRQTVDGIVEEIRSHPWPNRPTLDRLNLVVGVRSFA